MSEACRVQVTAGRLAPPLTRSRNCKVSYSVRFESSWLEDGNPAAGSVICSPMRLMLGSVTAGIAIPAGIVVVPEKKQQSMDAEYTIIYSPRA